jgi:hypothetical protein
MEGAYSQPGQAGTSRGRTGRQLNRQDAKNAKDTQRKNKLNHKDTKDTKGSIYRSFFVLLLGQDRSFYTRTLSPPCFNSFILIIYVVSERRQKTKNAEAQSSGGWWHEAIPVMAAVSVKAKELKPGLTKLNQELHIQRQHRLHGTSPVFPSLRLCVSAFIS